MPEWIAWSFCASLILLLAYAGFRIENLMREIELERADHETCHGEFNQILARVAEAHSGANALLQARDRWEDQDTFLREIHPAIESGLRPEGPSPTGIFLSHEAARLMAQKNKDIEEYEND